MYLILLWPYKQDTEVFDFLFFSAVETRQFPFLLPGVRAMTEQVRFWVWMWGKHWGSVLHMLLFKWFNTICQNFRPLPLNCFSILVQNKMEDIYKDLVLDFLFWLSVYLFYANSILITITLP